MGAREVVTVGLRRSVGPSRGKILRGRTGALALLIAAVATADLWALDDVRPAAPTRLRLAGAWNPPAGIPRPDFGIDEKVTMYAGQKFDFDQDGQLEDGEDYKDAGNGPYTHYVDNSGNCNDSNVGGYGDVNDPLCSIPTSLRPGSVVEVHGGPYAGLRISSVRGRAGSPIFIRGSSTDKKARFTEVVVIRDSSYVILENIMTDGAGMSITQHTDHVSVRHSEAANLPMPPYCPDKLVACYFSSTWNLGSDRYWAEGKLIQDVVMYDNEIHHNGDYVPTYESGVHGFSITNACKRIWIVDNYVHHNAEDGLQIYGGARGPYAEQIYIGRNRMVFNGENGVDIKQSFDVIISENEFAGYRATDFPKSGSDGSAIVLNDDAPNDRLWVLYNKVHDSTVGIRSQSSGSVYVVGNAFRDIFHEPDQTPPTSPGRDAGVAIWTSSAANVYAVANTAHRVHGGFYVIHGTNVYCDNNIFADVTYYHLAINTGAIPGDKVFQNVLTHNTGGARGVALCLDCRAGDPGFRDPSSFDYTCAAGSPAIDAGRESPVYSTFLNRYGRNIAVDLRGNVRPQGRHWDIGAVESVPVP